MGKTLFLSGVEPKIIKKLNDMGYKTLMAQPNASLDTPISSHGDCLLFNIDESTIFVEEKNYNIIVKYLTTGEGRVRNIIKVTDIKSPYPDDVKLNAKVFGRAILCNTECISYKIKDFANSNGFTFMHCNQGYASCSTVKLSNNAAITDDISVYNTLNDNGIDCVIVSKGSVKLNGYSYGFIGGCCGMIENNLLAFAGNIDTHSDAQLIKNFLNKHNINYINLTDSELIDIGGIITL